MKKLLLVLLLICNFIFLFGGTYSPDVKYGLTDIYPKKFLPLDYVTIYFFGKKSKEIVSERKKIIKKSGVIPLYPEKVFLHYGFNNWKRELTVLDGQEPVMEYDSKIDCWKYAIKLPEGVTELNFTFKDDLNNWDNNNGKDYIFKVAEDREPPLKLHLTKTLPAIGETIIEWQPSPEKDLQGYIIYRDGQRMNDTPVKESYYKDSSTLDGKEYLYKITAIDTSRNESDPLFVNIRTAKNVINMPDMDYLTGVISDSKLKLVATLEDIYLWKLQISNNSGDILRTYYGKSNSLNIFWDFKTDKGETVKPGSYKYIVSIMNTDNFLNRELPIRVIE